MVVFTLHEIRLPLSLMSVYLYTEIDYCLILTLSDLNRPPVALARYTDYRRLDVEYSLNGYHLKSLKWNKEKQSERNNPGTAEMYVVVGFKSSR